MARVADVDGDGQDEVILYNAEEIVVYHDPEPSMDASPPSGTRERLCNFTYY
jgi:hypothetical protein